MPCFICPDVGPPSPRPSAPPQPPDVLPDTGPTVSASDGTLGFTNSSYGGMIPIVYGADRLAGNVIWASAPVTVTGTINGTPYTYQVVSLAVGICEGPINGMLRMWVGPNLIIDNTINVDGNHVAQPGADGVIGSYAVDITDPTSILANLDSSARTTVITVYNGTETQLAEGIMVAAEGYEATPAYRGLAYVMLENFIITNNSLPAMFFEITSHTISEYPRQYGDFVATTFDTWRYDLLTYDPSYDRFYTVGSKTSPAARGLSVWNGNTVQELAQFEINNAFSIGPSYDTICICPLSGHLVVTEPSGNNGFIRTINHRSGGVMASFGPGGNLSGHGIAGNGITPGMADLGATTVVAFTCPDVSGNPIDVFCGVGTINQSVGFAQIGADGSIAMLSTLNGVTPWINNAIGVFTISTDFFALSPINRRFYDSYSSWGTHVYGFSWQNNESTSIKVWRVTVSRSTQSGSTPVTPSAPVYKELAAIPVDRFGGTGFTYAVRLVMLDRQDNCFVLVVDSAGRGSFICKYSPFTGLTRWVKSITDLPSSVNSQSGPGESWGILRGTYCWIDGAGVVWKINLINGSISQVTPSLTGQTLPALSNAKQFFNGFESSITYLTATASKHITKVFVDRLTRSTVELSDIVVDLVLRTGMLASDVNVVDLAALTLRGYTISQIKSVRAALAELAQVFTYDVVESNGKILYKTRGNGVDVIVPHDYIQGSGGSNSVHTWLETRQENDGARLRKINLTYRDINRLYESNVQSVILTKYGNQVFDPEAFIDVSVPIVLDANQAKSLAEILLYGKLTYATTYKFTLAPRYLYLDAADVLTLTMPVGEDDITVRLRTVTVDSDNFVACQASEENADIYNDQIDLFGATGRFETQRIPPLPPRIDPFPLLIPGRSSAEIGELTASHRLFFTFLNASYAVLSDYISIKVDSGTYSVAPPANFPTWGYVVTPPLATKSFAGSDDLSAVVVDIQNTSPNALIASALTGKADLLASDTVNLCYIAGELFQFITAVQVVPGGSVVLPDSTIVLRPGQVNPADIQLVSPNLVAISTSTRWKLTGLHRAKFGSDWAVGLAKAGDRFVLLSGTDGILDEDVVRKVDCPVGATANKLVQIFMNTGNPFQPPFSQPVLARNLKPFAVADFQMAYVSTDAVMTWQRRDRSGDGSYPDNGAIPPSETVPQPEASETYDLYLYKNNTTVDFTVAATYLRKVTVTVNTFTYTAAMQTADGFVRATDSLYVSIQQNGTLSNVEGGNPQEYFLAHT